MTIRKVFKRIGLGNWEMVSMIELKEGDVFRLYSSTGDQIGTTWKAMSNGFISDKKIPSVEAKKFKIPLTPMQKIMEDLDISIDRAVEQVIEKYDIVYSEKFHDR